MKKIAQLTMVFLSMNLYNLQGQKNGLSINIGISGGSSTTLAPLFSFAYHRSIVGKMQLCFRYIQCNANEKFDIIVFDERAYSDFNKKYIAVNNTSDNPVVDFTNFTAFNMSIFYPLYHSSKESFNIGIGASKIKRHKLKNIESGSLIEFFYFNTYSESFIAGQIDVQYQRKIFKDCNLLIGGFYLPKLAQFAGNAGLVLLF